MDGYVIVNILGGLLIITSLMVVLAKTAKVAAIIYAAQSLVLVSIFIALGITTGSTELYTWAATAFVTKVLLVPGMILFALKKMGNPEPDLKPVLSPLVAVILVAVEVIVCFVAVQGINLPTAIEVKPALAISLAHFFIGLTCIVSQRSIIKQIFGYCLMENGSHVSLALLAPKAPELVEVGIATDAIFAVLIMVVVAYRIYKKSGSLNADDLMKLKG